MSGSIVVIGDHRGGDDHETGHFLTARATGMKVTEYFFGFGPRLWSRRRARPSTG